MDRKLHGIPAMELTARACYTACALTDIQEHKCAALMYVQRILPTHTALEQHVKSVVLGSNPCLTTFASSFGAWDKTDNGLYEPHWTTFQRPTTVGYLWLQERCCSCCKCKKATCIVLNKDVGELLSTEHAQQKASMTTPPCHSQLG